MLAGKKKYLQALGPLFGAALFILALWILHRELRASTVNDIVGHLKRLPPLRLTLALFLTGLSYFIMTGYDAIALRYIRHILPYGKIALASFIGYAFSNNVGLSMVAGASVRFRLYSVWGLTGFEIAKVVAFCSLSLWLGFLTLAGVTFIAEPLNMPQIFHLSFISSTRPIGFLFIFLVVSYCVLSALRQKPFQIMGRELALPSISLFLIQMTVALLDWILAGSVLFVLLPAMPEMSFFGFLNIFLLAQLAGLMSQVPGGLGVFETVALLLLSSKLPSPVILSSLVAYRGIYYLLPLLAAAVLLGAQEALQKKSIIIRIGSYFNQSASIIVPQVLAVTTFIGGAMLLFSGALPALNWRLAWLYKFMPLPVMEVSHFLGSVAGAGLLLLARGLQRRLDAAYVLTIILLSAGIVFSLFKGLDYEEAVILSIMLASFLPSRRYFYRKASLFSQRFSKEWGVAIILVFACVIWLGLFAFKHVEYSSELWWKFSLASHASRFLRATVGAIALAFIFSIYKLLTPAPPAPSLPGSAELEKIQPIVSASKRAYANLVYLQDKSILLDSQHTAFIMYGIEGRSWVAMGDPIGPTGKWDELIWQFRERCDLYDGWPVFYEVSPDKLQIYLELGLTVFKFGEEARVPLNSFSLEGSARKGLRHTHRKLVKEGCVFEVIPPEALSAHFPKLKLISDAWLEEKNTREKSFSLGSFNEDYLKRFSFGLVRQAGEICAFANIWPSADREELSIDLMRHIPESPSGVMDFLFIELMLWGKDQGYKWFNLGMAPLSGLEGRSLAPVWNKIGALIFSYGEYFYNFQGLRQYKEKFDPVWEARYLVAPGGLGLPNVLINIASLNSGGLTGTVSK